jgi:predicted  nucleic acid-binding Zn ribbon protein
MEIVQLIFRSARSGNQEVGFDRIQSYLAALHQNGQILGDSPTAKIRGGYLVFVGVPRGDATDARHGNRWVRQTAARLRDDGLRPPEIRLLGHEPDTPEACRCRRRRSLILFTNFLSDESPVRCGACFGPVPLFTLPRMGDAADYSDILRWQSAYQAMDTLHIGSGPGERFAHRQMSDVRSALSRDGREVGEQIEKKTGRPVYYYLMKHYGVSDRLERRRRCPLCKGAWLLGKPQHGIFDFRCDRCRLLSNVAFDVRSSSASVSVR